MLRNDILGMDRLNKWPQQPETLFNKRTALEIFWDAVDHIRIIQMHTKSFSVYIYEQF